MSISAISRRYAKALVNLGAEQKMVERYGEELAQMREVFTERDMLRLIVESPTFPLEKKKAIMADLGDSMKLSGGMKNFVGLLVEKDRLKYLPQIAADYRDFADGLSGVLRARISTAAPLDEAQRKAIGSGLEKKTGMQVKLTVDLDPALLGGIKAQFCGKVFDGSIRTQLNRIEDTLKKG